MAGNYHALPKGPAMIPPTLPPKSSTPRRVSGGLVQAAAPAHEQDFAIGCECAYPALQIETWRHETAAQSQIVTVPVLQAVPA
jgi:hypothetical protein